MTKNNYLIAACLFLAPFCCAVSANENVNGVISPDEFCAKNGVPDKYGNLEDTVNDISTLNPTTVACVVQPHTAEEVVSSVKWVFDWNTRNTSNHMGISVAGTRHSQGGHIASNGGITLDLSRLNKVYNPVQRNGLWEVKVQSGALWHQIHDVIKQYNGLSLANKVQQSSTPFSVGGSVSVNAHGRNFSYGSMIHSVRAISIVLPSGELVEASRAQNSDIFRLAIGGYGLFGVITDVTLELVPNHNLSVESRRFETVESYIDYITTTLNGVDRGKITRDENGRIMSEQYSPIAYLFTTVALDKKHFLQGINSYIYHQKESVDYSGNVNPDPEPTIVNLRAWITKIGFIAKRYGYLIKTSQKLQHNYLLEQDTRLKTLTPPIKPILAAASKSRPDLLQEYFIPVDKVPEFFETMRGVFTTNGIVLSNVSLRFIPKSSDRGFLSYVSETEDQFAIVLYFSMKLDSENIKKAGEWTRGLVQSAIDLGGSYYLPYQRWPSKEQFEKSYPMFRGFIDWKKRLDPHKTFTNTFYKYYLSGSG